MTVSSPCSTAPVDRWIVSGTLTALSPLMLRNGEDELPPPASGENLTERQRKAAEAAIGEIEVDANGKPYVPATALKGLVRRLAAARLPETLKDFVYALLGDMPRTGRSHTDPDALVGIGGAAEFRDAFVEPGQPDCILQRSQTAIHDGTRAADVERRALRNQKFVATDARFTVEIVLDRASANTVALLIELLTLVDGVTPESAIGAKTGQGAGRVTWELGSVERLDAAAICAWLAEPDDLPWRGKAAVANDLAEPRERFRAMLRPAASVTLAISISFDGPFLVSHDEPGTSTLRPISSRGSAPARAELPGSSLDGALRAQAERIWRTLANNPTDWKEADIPTPIKELFGTTRGRGLLDVADFAGALQAAATQEFVGIDRFTGGQSNGKKFAVEGFESPRLSGSLSLTFDTCVTDGLTGKQPSEEPAELSPKALGLLALTLRDLAEGDIPLGFGTRKGYGRVGAIALENAARGVEPLLIAIGKAWLAQLGNPQASDEVAKAAICAAVTALRGHFSQPAAEGNQEQGE